jgi:hypothetical protein
MIAVDPPVRILTLLLHPRGRPHMHQRHLNMLVSPDGQERTVDEFAAQLGNAGFRMERIIEVTPGLSIVEAAPI